MTMSSKTEKVRLDQVHIRRRKGARHVGAASYPIREWNKVDRIKGMAIETRILGNADQDKRDKKFALSSIRTFRSLHSSAQLSSFICAAR